MKARVYVSLKQSVLDPQGQTIARALAGQGHHEIVDVRQGKVFDITLDAGIDRAVAEKSVGQIARDVLTNPVIEECRIEILD